MHEQDEENRKEPSEKEQELGPTDQANTQGQEQDEEVPWYTDEELEELARSYGETLSEERETQQQAQHNSEPEPAVQAASQEQTRLQEQREQEDQERRTQEEQERRKGQEREEQERKDVEAKWEDEKQERTTHHPSSAREQQENLHQQALGQEAERSGGVERTINTKTKLGLVITLEGAYVVPQYETKITEKPIKEKEQHQEKQQGRSDKSQPDQNKVKLLRRFAKDNNTRVQPRNQSKEREKEKDKSRDRER